MACDVHGMSWSACTSTCVCFLLWSQLCVLLQVQLPSWLQGNVTGSSPEAQLKQIIRSCLHTASQQRPSASRVQELLYTIMVQQGWSNQMRPVA